jgi:hypothetical protein
VRQRLPHQVLAAAIADLDGEAGQAGKERGRVEGARAETDFERGQLVVKQPVLPLVQPLARAPSEEGARLAGCGERRGLGDATPPLPPP